ncbi:MAG: HEAT repeat domain-containing protein, partial [Proteobacteria bacterium]|nr:HEAT repeat domain-containing protein [Pseudomonadota bacterium]
MQQLTSNDIAERRAAAFTLATDDPESYSEEELLPLIKQAMQDVDHEVQKLGTATAGRVAFAIQPLEHKRRGLKPKIDLSVDPEIKKLLVKAMNADVDISQDKEDSGNEMEMQKSAARAIMFTYPSSVIAELEKNVVNLLKQEAFNAGFRGTLLQMMALGGYRSADAREALFAALKDVHPYVQSEAALAIGKIRPEGGISQLLSAYPLARKDVQESILRAISFYRQGNKRSSSELEKKLDEITVLQQQLRGTREAA